MAASLAAAEAAGSTIGGRVGYSIPFESVLSTAPASPPPPAPGAATAIVFYCAETLLRSALADPLFTGCSVVVVSLGGPGCERALATDALLGVLSRVLARRPDLRLVLTADDAGNASSAARYFGWRPAGGGATAPPGRVGGPARAAALLSVGGPTAGGGTPASFQPALQYTSSPVSDFHAAAVDAVTALHASDRPGDILVILPRPSDVDAVAEALKEEGEGGQGEVEGRGGSSSRKRGRPPRLAVTRLHGGVPRDELAASLSPAAPAGSSRRAIIALSSALDGGRLAWAGVSAVVDAVLGWQAGFDPASGLDASGVAPVSRATADLRAGLSVGVHGDRPGVCVRLLTEDAFAALPPSPPPSVRRHDLSPTLLLLAALGVGDALAFPWPSRPPAAAAARALETLHALGALGGDGRALTAGGQAMAELPLADPRAARALLSAGSTGDPAVVDSVAAAIALSTVRGIWSRGAAGGSAAGLAAAKARFAAAEGDWVTHLNVWRAWHAAGSRDGGGVGRGPPSSGARAAWAGANGIDHRALLRAADVAGQVRAHAGRVGLPTTPDGRAGLAPPPAGGAKAAAAAIVRALAAGLFVSAAVLTDAHGAPGGQAAYRLVRPPDGPPPGRDGSATLPAQPRLRLHRSSILHGSAPPLVLFLGAPLDREGWHTMMDVLCVSRDLLVGVAPHFFQGG